MNAHAKLHPAEQDVISDFVSSMREHGLETEDAIVADGELHRFHVTGDRPGSENGWFILFLDDKPAGQFGCNKRFGKDHRIPWSYRGHGGRNLTSFERAELKRKQEEQRAAKAEAEAIRQEEARQVAVALWESATPVDEHPYLTAKGVSSHGLRLGTWVKTNRETGEVWFSRDDALLVPQLDKGRNLHNLQAIFPEKCFNQGTRDKDYLYGGKRKGVFFPIGSKALQHDGKPVYLIGEGYSTCASAHECTGHIALACFDTSNLMHVARAIRESKPHAVILFLVDNDQWVTQPVQNPGLHYARAAATEVRGLLAVPPFAHSEGVQQADGSIKGPSDINDLHQMRGPDAVAKVIGDALAGGILQADYQSEPETSTGLAPDAPLNDEQVPAPQPSSTRDEERRRLQQEENQRLQKTDIGAMVPSKLTVEEMLKELVWVAEGSQVAHVSADRTLFLKYSEFVHLTAESKTELENESKKKVKTAQVWKQSPNRIGCMTRTFAAGGDLICTDPDGKRAVNTWRPINRWEANADIKPFLAHVDYLFDDEAGAFLNWLAHLEQKPGELPHYGWLHVADHTGCGRNWLASVLARVWRGYVAPNVDLPGLLSGPYNGMLAGRILAVVDEVQEGGHENSYRHTNQLKSLLNAEYRDINPKYGSQYREHNACRWMVFSNHLNALPINDTDRRWRAVVLDKPPRSAETYADLYAKLSDREFINAVGAFLAERDISQFRPGERPPMNAAKRAMVSASKTLLQQRAEEIVEKWPADLISTIDAAELLSDGEQNSIKPNMRRALEEVGAVDLCCRPKIDGKPQRLWAIRNATNWLHTDNDALRREMRKARTPINELDSATMVLSGAYEGSASQLAGANKAICYGATHLE